MKKLWMLTMTGSLLSFSALAQETTTVIAPPPEEWKANAGLSAILNTGNSENMNIGGNSVVSRKWEMNKITFDAKGAYGRAKDPATGTKSTNTKNWKTQLRYDRYITDPISLFGLGHAGQDKPSGFDWRYGGSLGMSHELYKIDPHFFKYEVGFDYTREIPILPPKLNLYSARLFLQYKWKISSHASFGQDVESLFDVEHGENVRINTLTALTVSITEKVAFQAGFEVRFDNVPVPGFKKLDTKTIAGLVINIM